MTGFLLLAARRRARRAPAGGGGGPIGARRIAAQAVRFKPGSASTICAMGFPLKDGVLTKAQCDAGYGRPMLSGSEVACDIVAPATTETGAYHASGCLKKVYLVLQRSLTKGAPELGEFRGDELRTLPPLGLGVDPLTFLNSPSATGPSGENYRDYYVVDGAFVPVAAADLCDSGLFGLTRPRAEDSTHGTFASVIADVDAVWDTYEPDAIGRTYDGVNARGWYYDRLKMYLHAWARTGNVEYLQTGFAQYARIKTDYYMTTLGGPYRVNEYNIGLHGWALAYWLFGDTDARAGVFGVANINGSLNQQNLGNADAVQAAPRFASNSIRAASLATDLGYSLTGSVSAWIRQALCDQAADAPALKTVPSFGQIDIESSAAPGVYITAPFGMRQWGKNTAVDATNVLNCALPYMDGLLCDALMHYYDKDPQLLIRDRIQQMADFWWMHMRIPAVSVAQNTPGTTLRYTSASYDLGVGNNSVSGSVNTNTRDLNGFNVRVYWWLAWKLANASYLAMGDELYEQLRRTPHRGGNENGPYMGITSADTKQFTEFGQFLHESVGIRAKAVAAIAALSPTYAAAGTWIGPFEAFDELTKTFVPYMAYVPSGATPTTPRAALSFQGGSSRKGNISRDATRLGGAGAWVTSALTQSGSLALNDDDMFADLIVSTSWPSGHPFVIVTQFPDAGSLTAATTPADPATVTPGTAYWGNGPTGNPNSTSNSYYSAIKRRIEEQAVRDLMARGYALDYQAFYHAGYSTGAKYGLDLLAAQPTRYAGMILSASSPDLARMAAMSGLGNPAVTRNNRWDALDAQKVVTNADAWYVAGSFPVGQGFVPANGGIVSTPCPAYPSIVARATPNPRIVDQKAAMRMLAQRMKDFGSETALTLLHGDTDVNNANRWLLYGTPMAECGSSTGGAGTAYASTDLDNNQIGLLDVWQTLDATLFTFNRFAGPSTNNGTAMTYTSRTGAYPSRFNLDRWTNYSHNPPAGDQSIVGSSGNPAAQMRVENTALWTWLLSKRRA